MPYLDLAEDNLSFPEIAKNLTSTEFLRTQREKFEMARMRAMVNKNRKLRKGKHAGGVKLGAKALRAKIQRKLQRRRKNKQMKQFLGEIRDRQAEGYSVRQLMKSHIPDIGSEIKVTAEEVKAALEGHEVVQI